jgi:hypothetical protein
MSQKSSLPQPAESVSRVLTADSRNPSDEISWQLRASPNVDLGVQSRSEVEWIVSESARLVCPGFADVLVGR